MKIDTERLGKEITSCVRDISQGCSSTEVLIGVKDNKLIVLKVVNETDDDMYIEDITKIKTRNIVDFRELEDTMGGDLNRLPKESVTFNPSEDEDVDTLLSKFGPEGLFEIAKRLRDVAMDDVDTAMNEE